MHPCQRLICTPNNLDFVPTMRLVQREHSSSPWYLKFLQHLLQFVLEAHVVCIGMSVWTLATVQGRLDGPLSKGQAGTCIVPPESEVSPLGGASFLSLSLLNMF